MKKFYLLGLTILLGICSCFGLLLSSNLPETSVKADDNFASICVIGEASTEISPDTAKVTAVIQTLSEDLEEAKDKNFEILNCAIDSLTNLGINKESIVTCYFNVCPKTDFGYDSKVIGYNATTNFTYEVENLDDIKASIDALFECGVTSVQSIKYEVSTYDEVYNQTLINALENAKVKASEICGQENMQIVSINEECVYCSSTLYRNYSDGMLDNDLVGKVNITAKLKVEFALN